MKVAIFGASGLVGSAFVEQVMGLGCKAPSTKMEVIPIVHSSGSAWRLARYGMELKSADLLSLDSIREAISGATHVINCTRGSEELMLDGLKNLLKICREKKIKRFVHLSSVAVYGDPPPLESEHEHAETKPEIGSYGWIKLQQDEIVQKAHKEGLSSIILCPPNITGPYSYFALDILKGIQKGTFALLDNGGSPVNLVDVANLVHAMELALTAERVDGGRYFITDGEAVTWYDFVNSFHEAFKVQSNLHYLDVQEFSGMLSPTRPPKRSLVKSFKHLFSDEVRGALLGDPGFEGLILGVRQAIKRMPALEDKLRNELGGKIQVPKVSLGQKYNVRLISQQRRKVLHLHQLASEKIGYTPIIDFQLSVKNFCNWYHDMHGDDEVPWNLLKELEVS